MQVVHNGVVVLCADLLHSTLYVDFGEAKGGENYLIILL